MLKLEISAIATAELTRVVVIRCTTSCLLCFLSATYTPWALLFQGLISLDFASHYIHMYA